MLCHYILDHRTFHIRARPGVTNSAQVIFVLSFFQVFFPSISYQIYVYLNLKIHFIKSILLFIVIDFKIYCGHIEAHSQRWRNSLSPYSFFIFSPFHCAISCMISCHVKFVEPSEGSISRTFTKLCFLLYSGTNPGVQLPLKYPMPFCTYIGLSTAKVFQT